MFPKIALFCKSTWKLRFCTCFNYQITFRKDREWAYWGIFSLSGNWGIVWKIWEQLNLRRTVLIFGSILSKLCNGVRRRLWDWIKLRERESGYGVWIDTSQRELEGFKRYIWRFIASLTSWSLIVYLAIFQPHRLTCMWSCKDSPFLQRCTGKLICS